MNTLTIDGFEELDRGSALAVEGGNPLQLGLAISTAFAAGMKFGFSVIGPYLAGDVSIKPCPVL